MPGIALTESRFGPIVHRYCLCIVLYYWEWALPPSERDRKIGLADNDFKRDLLAAVKPFLDEIEAGLEDPDCTAAERHALRDFQETYEAVLATFHTGLEGVKANWNILQVTSDRKVNHALYKLLRGLDLRKLQIDLDEAARLVVKGWTDLVHIGKRRTLCRPVRRLIDETAPMIGELRREVREVDSVLRSRAGRAAEDAAPRSEGPRQLIVDLGEGEGGDGGRED